ncbi:MAG: FG-GAP repeat protein [Phycisphaerales bacterium]
MWFKSSFPIPAVVAISFCLIGGTTPAYADLGDQLFKLLADDGAAFDRFGVSVAISGSTAIVGAMQDDDNGIQSGSAYLFDTTTGRQIAKLLPNDGAAWDRFGVSVAISGATTIIGAFRDDDNGIQSGSAYLFDTTTGVQIVKLLPDDGALDDHFGFSVAISGDTAIVGAAFDDDNGSNSGSAYLFDINTGQQIAKLLPDDGTAEDRFGRSVAIDETIGKGVAIVGAYLDNDNGFQSGSAYLFNITTGQQIAKLLPNDSAFGDLFGWSVAIRGSVAIVGARFGNDKDNGIDSGSAYLFDTTTGRQLFKLLPNDGAAIDQFGWSVSISAVSGKEIAIVGALGDDDNGANSGSAYLFNTTTGKQIAKLLPDDGTAGDEFGESVAIGGDTAIVGAWKDYSGSAYLFDAAAPGTCPWDLQGDGIVGPGDLLILLGWWGFDPGGPPDFDGDGNVGASDLLALLANWGPCP